MDGTPGMQRGWSRSWSASFDAVAEAYDEARPGYPPRLYEELKDICGTGRSSHVLEIGCGTGQATRDIAPLVGSVVALEPGESLARMAQTRLERFPNVEVRQVAFEDFDCEPGAFDLIISATAFHWVDSGVGFGRTAELLRPGGWLALWWHVYHDPDGDDPFGEEVTCLIGDGTGAGDADLEYALRADERISDFAKSSKFGAVETRRYRWNGDHSAREIRSLFSTYSNIQAKDETERNRILDGIEELANSKFGGRVKRPYVTALYAAKKETR